MAYAESDPYELIPVAQAEVPRRVAFMRQVGIWTLGSLGITAVAAALSMYAVVSVTFLQGRWTSMAVMLGGIYGAQFIGRFIAGTADRSTQMMGFVAGSAAQGTALGYIMLTAVMMSIEQYSQPFVFIGQAGALVAMTVLGMVAYLLTGPRNLSLLGSMMSMLTLPMLGLMAFSWFWPVGGVFGMILSLVFVGVSAAGLFYSLNNVMHRYSTEMVIPGAFQVSIGIVVLFWNVLTLLMRLQRR